MQTYEKQDHKEMRDNKTEIGDGIYILYQNEHVTFTLFFSNVLSISLPQKSLGQF